MKKVNFQSKNGQSIAISAVINSPQAFDESKTYPAVVVAHPGGGVKEQTAGLYARKLAEAGFVTIAFQIVAGSMAGSRWTSDDLYKRAASANKKFHVVEGSNHVQLYDVPKYVDEAVSVLASFFKANLQPLPTNL